MVKLYGSFFVILLLVACGKQQAKEIQETRTVEAQPAGTSSPHGAMGGSALDQVMPPDHPPISPYTWELPAGWLEASPTPMRVGNFKVEASPETECYITVISGLGGGLAANVNRWQQQMGQPTMDDAAIAALPTVEMLGQKATFVEIDGDFTGMSGQQKSGFKMLGALCPLAEQTIFLKMTGPAPAVEAEKDKFKAFCASLKEGGVATDASLEKVE